MKIKINLPDGIIEETFELERVVIGRSTRCDFCCPHEGLSRNHCLVELIDEKIFITDLGSSNGVYIDDNRIDPHVRILYNHYNSLNVGPFECTIEDVEEKNIEIIQQERTKLKNNKPQPRVSKTKKAFSNHTYLKVLAPILIFSMVVMFFVNPFKNTETSQTKTSAAVSPQPKLKKIPPIFKSTALYLAEERDKNCLDQLEIYCKKMNLNPKYEGFFRYEKDLTIYLKPSLYLGESRYKGIKNKTDALELIAMDKVLSSPVMDDFFRNSDFQIHLVLKNELNEVFKVSRFHPEIYSPRTAQRMDALSLLEGAIIGASTTELFWRHVNAYVSETTRGIE